MSGMYGIGTDLLTLQNAAAASKLIRASKTFTGAANLGAVGVNELFTTTGCIALESFFVRCTSDLVDAVDGALFRIGVTGANGLFTGSGFEGVFDLDTINAGDLLSPFQATDGHGLNMAWDYSNWDPYFRSEAIVDNIIMTISGQAITGGVLEFYVLYRPLSSDGALSLGAGMTQI